MDFERLQKGTSEDYIKLRGCLEIALLDAESKEVLQSRKVDNTVVTSGRSYVLSRLVSGVAQTDVINAIAVGTAPTAPATSDTGLTSESLRISIASFATAGLTNNPPSWQAQCTFLEWGRAIVRWLREFSLIELNPEMGTVRKALAF